MGAYRTAAKFTCGVLVAGLLAACDAAESDSDGTGPGKAADALGAALASGEFDDVEFSDETSEAVAKSYQKIVEGMGDVTPTVEVGKVSESDGTGAAELQWTWALGEQEWSYAAEGELLKAGDDWVVKWDPAVIEPSLNESVVLDATPIRPERATVLGARGLALVADRPVVRLGIDRGQVAAAKAGDSARQLAQLVGIDVAPYVKQVKVAGDKAFVEAIVYRQEDVPADVLRDYDQIPGAVALADERPLAPTREFAAPILGTVGEVTAEMIEENPDRYQLGDQAGLSGLQARYDEQLAGTPGVVVDAVGSDGKERELFREEPVPGEPLKLTLDIDLQQDAERLLSSVGPASALVAIKPSNGDIVVAANGPGNDGYNIATYGQVAPGSTFKSVSSLALLRAGLTPESIVPCTDTIVVDGKQFENYDDYPSSALGRIPLRTAVANSCNTGIISQASRLKDDSLVDAAASLGVGIDHDLGFPAFFGTVEPPSSETEKAADMIGQGGILASPMAMATVAASIQSGKPVLPRLVKTWDVEPGVAPVLSRSEAAQVREMLRGVVTSGSGSFLADVPGPPVIAKTGTAEFEKDGKILTHAWMIAAQDDLAVAVYVDIGDSGSGTAGPILESFLRDAQ